MTVLQKFGIGAFAFIVLIVAGIIGANISYNHGYSAAGTVWKDSLSHARDIHREWIDSTLKAQAKQTIAFKNKPKPDTTQYIDIEPTQEDSTIFHAGFNSGIDYEKHQVDILDTTLVYSNGDSLHAYHNSITHQVTLGLTPYPEKEYTHNTSDSLLVGIPCAPIPWYDSNRAHEAYGGAAVLVIVWLSHLVAK